MNIKGITEQKAEKIYEAANKIESMGFQSGLAILEKRKKIKKISTGSRNFDMLLRNQHVITYHYCRRRNREHEHH